MTTDLRLLFLALLAFSLSMTIFTTTASAQATPAAPRPFTPQETVIYSPLTFEPRLLQFLLLKGLVQAADADTYNPLTAAKELDPSKAPAFAVFNKIPALPEGKSIIAIVSLQATPNDPFVQSLGAQRLEKLSKAKPGAVLIAATPKGIVIASNSLQTLPAVGLFLNRVAGIRLYAPGRDDLWLSTPNNQALAVKENIFVEPAFFKATFSTQGYQPNKLWEMVNTPITQGRELRAMHTINNYFDPNVYYDTQPNLFPMGRDGKRLKPTGTAWNPCLADPKASADTAMIQIRKEMAKPSKPTFISMGMMDMPYECHDPICSACLKDNDGEAGPLWFAYLNQLAKQCQAEFPGLPITTYSYSNVNLPAGMKVEPNIVIDHVVKSYTWSDPVSLAGLKSELLTIGNSGAGWVLHDWCFSGITPRIYSGAWASFLQWGAQHGMRGIYVEWSHSENWYLDGANYWVLKQLLSDPYQDPDLLWRQYCRDMYGPGAESMFLFYKTFQQKHLFYQDHYTLSDVTRQDVTGYSKQEIAYQRTLLETTRRLTASDAKIQARLQIVERYFRSHELFALATSEPAQSFHRHTRQQKRTDLNKDALAFYVNDDGKTLLEAIDFYANKRTVAPDANTVNLMLDEPASLRNNYALALGTILSYIQTQAIQKVGLADITPAKVQALQAAAGEIFTQNLPASFNAARADELKSLAQKFLWIPTGTTLPTIDGTLSDDAWKAAAPLDGFTLADLFVPSPQGNITSGKIMRVGDSLAIALTCQQPGGAWATTTPDIKTGSRIWRESCVQVFFGPRADPNSTEKPKFCQYIVNSLGAMRGFGLAADNQDGVTCAAKTAPDNKSYTIEMILPLKVQGRYDLTKEPGLSFNIMREVYASNTYASLERLGWFPIFFTAQWPESRTIVFSKAN